MCSPRSRSYLRVACCSEAAAQQGWQLRLAPELRLAVLQQAPGQDGPVVRLAPEQQPPGLRWRRCPLEERHH